MSSVMSAVSAYWMKNAAMQPVKKISVTRLRWGVVLLIAYWLLIFAGTHLPHLPPSAGDQISDKVKHFGAFFGLATLLCFVTAAPESFRRIAAVVAIAFVYGIFDELTQMLVPGRHADWLDLAADTGGILTAVVLYTTAWIVYRNGRRAPGPRWQRY